MSKVDKTDHEARQTITVGLFSLLGLVLLIIAVYLIGSKRDLFTSTFNVFASFSDVNGLQSGDEVRYRGIPVGTVKEVSILNDSVIKVKMVFRSKIKPYIRKNAVASIATDGLMGNKIVNIRNAGRPTAAIEENDTLKTIKPIDAEDASRKLAASNENISIITTNLTQITDKINKGKGPLGTLLNDSNLAKDLNHGVKNLEKGAVNINKESEALKKNFLFKKYFKEEKKK